MVDGEILAVHHLTVVFQTKGGSVPAVDDVSFSLRPGEVLGVVGESGSGKTTLGRAILRLVPSPGAIVAGTISFRGLNLLALGEEDMRRVRGSGIGMVFQNPMRSLHPGLTIGSQLREALRAHSSNIGRREATLRAIEILTRVEFPGASTRLGDYPHQLSGGMQQRVMIAMALMNSPAVLVADEPTTALDVTVQAQILELIRSLAAEQGMGVLLITHNFGVIAELCDRVIVMYAGQVVEESHVTEAFAEPLHPYTRGLLDSLPERTTEPRLRAIPGSAPHGSDVLLQGCRFRNRCALAERICDQSPGLVEMRAGRTCRCWVAQRNGFLPSSDDATGAEARNGHQ
jgi:peptide/nickel transport system ATP-binding protein